MNGQALADRLAELAGCDHAVALRHLDMGRIRCLKCREWVVGSYDSMRTIEAEYNKRARAAALIAAKESSMNKDTTAPKGAPPQPREPKK